MVLIILSLIIYKLIKKIFNIALYTPGPDFSGRYIKVGTSVLDSFYILVSKIKLSNKSENIFTRLHFKYFSHCWWDILLHSFSW